MELRRDRRKLDENRCVNELMKFDKTETLLANILKNRSDNFRRILEGMKWKYLRKLARNATDELKTCDKKRCWELIIDIFLLNCLKQK